MDLLRLTLRQGSVYLMQDRRLTSPVSHFFIVLNGTPLDDQVLLLAVATSQVASLKLRRRNLPAETVVELGPVDYPTFNRPSAVDCNSIFEMPMAELRERIRTRQAESRPDFPAPVVRMLVSGALASPMVTPAHKQLIRS